MFFIHKHDKWCEKVLTITLRALSWAGPFDFTTNCKSGKLCRQIRVCLSFLAPQTTVQANFKDDVFCGSILLF